MYTSPYIAATVNTAKCHYIIFSVIPLEVKSFNNQSRFFPHITLMTTFIFLTGPGLSHNPQGDQQLTFWRRNYYFFLILAHSVYKM